MKYLIVSDLGLLFKKYKLVIMYIFIPILYSLFLILFLNVRVVSNDVLYSILTVNYKINNCYDFLILIFNISIFCYLELLIFNNDFVLNKSFIFLRVSTNKWLVYRLISNFLFSIILSAVEIMSIILIFKLLNVTYFINLFNVIKYILIKAVTGLLFFLIYCHIGNKSIFFIIIVNLIFIIIAKSSFYSFSKDIFMPMTVSFKSIILFWLSLLIYTVIISKKNIIYRRIYD